MNISLFCVGNELELDDGLGPAVYDELKSYEFSGPGFTADPLHPFDADAAKDETSQVAIFDLACMSLDYVELVNESDLVITVDAIDGTGQEPGTIFRYSPDDMMGRSPATESLHDLKLKGLFDAAAFLGYNAKGVCYGMQVKNPDPPTHMIGLTTPVHQKLAQLVDTILAELVNDGVSITEIATGKKVQPGFHHTLQTTDEVSDADEATDVDKTSDTDGTSDTGEAADVGSNEGKATNESSDQKESAQELFARQSDAIAKWHANGHKKYFLFDFDGTLRSRTTDEIPASTLDALDRLREAGHFVGLATGRLQADAMRLVPPTGIHSMVADGGNSITIDDKVVWMESMPLDDVKDLLHRLNAKHVPWGIVTKNEPIRYTDSPKFVELVPPSYMDDKLVDHIDIDALDCVYKVFVPVPRGKEETLPIAPVTWARYSDVYAICEPIDKARGIRKLMDIMHADLSDVVVFGDGKNDLSMFDGPWCSIAMGNAIPELKQKASIVTTSVDDDGIARALRALGYIENVKGSCDRS